MAAVALEPERRGPPVATVTRLGLSAELPRRILWDAAARLLNLS
jgi:hypothetical protein